MKKCPNCLTELQDHMSFCWKCGRDQSLPTGWDVLTQVLEYSRSTSQSQLEALITHFILKNGVDRPISAAHILNRVFAKFADPRYQLQCRVAEANTKLLSVQFQITYSIEQDTYQVRPV